MKRYSASSRQAQQWIKESSLDYLKISSIYDKLGHFKLSEQLYNKSVKLSSFIRLSEDEENEEILGDEEANQEDVDVLVVPEVNSDEYVSGQVYKFYQEGVVETGTIAVHDFYDNNNFGIREYVSALSLGGQNVLNSLKELAHYFANHVFDFRGPYFEEDTKNKFITALAWYYKNPIFIESEFNQESKLLAKNIYDNNVTQDSVAIVARALGLLNERKQSFKTQEDKVKQLISELRPELFNDANVVKFLCYVKIKHFSDPSIEEFFKNKIREFYYPAFQKSVSISGTMASVYILYHFFIDNPSEIIYNKTKAVLADKKDFYNLKDSTQLEELVIGRNLSYISRWMFKLHPGLLDALALNVNNSNEDAIKYPDLNIALMAFGAEYVAQAWNDGKKLDSNNIAERYYIEFPDNKLKIETKIVAYLANISDDVKQKTLRNLEPKDVLAYSGYQFSKIEYLLFEICDRASPEFGIEVCLDLHDKKTLYLLGEMPQSYIPVFIKYYEKNASESYRLSDRSDFLSFIKLYTKIGDKIFEYQTWDMLQLSESIFYNYNLSGSAADCFSESDANLTCEQFDIVKSHSGQDDQFDHFKNIYFECPFIYDVPFEKIFNLVKFINHNPPKKWVEMNKYPANLDINLSYIEYKEAIGTNHDFKFAIKNLYLLGEYNPSLVNKIEKIETSSINAETKSFYRTLLTDSIYGDFERLNNISTFCSKNKDLDLSEIEAVPGPLNNTRSQILKIREIIFNPRNRNYANLQIGSDDYKKIFHMIAANGSIGGKSVELLTSLFDNTIFRDEIDTIFRNSKFGQLKNIFKISVALNITDFSKANYENLIIINDLINLCNEKIKTYQFPLEDALSTLGLRPAQLINVGGWKSLRSKNENEIDEFLRSINHRDPDNFKMLMNDRWSIYEDFILESSEIFIRLDINILKNKFIIQSLREFNSIVNLADIIFDENKVDYSRSSGIKKQFREYLENSDFQKNWVDGSILQKTDQFRNYVMDVYRGKVSYPENVINPTYFVDYNKMTLRSESVTNASKIIALFGNNSKSILDTFSFKYCRGQGYPTKGFYSVPDYSVRASIIHDLANLLPDDLIGQTFPGYAGYFIKHYPEDKSNHLKLVGNSWNNTIRIWDENKKEPLEIGTVSEFSHRFTPQELFHIINIDSLQNVLKGELQCKNDEYAVKFVTKVGMPNTDGNKSVNYKLLYSGTEEVYMMGLKVSLPEWANYADSYDGIFMRFLKKNDPSGMFLGIDTKCCQHPRDYAASCAYDGYVNPDAAFAVFENIKGELLYQSYVWADEKNNICFDSIEGATRELRNDEKSLSKVKILLQNFNKSLPRGTICTTGSSYFGNLILPPLINPSKTNEIPIIKDLLEEFSPNKNNRFYNMDSTTQFVIGVD